MEKGGERKEEREEDDASEDGVGRVIEERDGEEAARSGDEHRGRTKGGLTVDEAAAEGGGSGEGEDGGGVGVDIEVDEEVVVGKEHLPERRENEVGVGEEEKAILGDSRRSKREMVEVPSSFLKTVTAARPVALPSRLPYHLSSPSLSNHVGDREEGG